MHVNLSPETEGFLRSKVASGFYGNATEVVCNAIRRMQAEESRVAAWQAALKAQTSRVSPIAPHFLGIRRSRRF